MLSFAFFYQSRALSVIFGCHLRLLVLRQLPDQVGIGVQQITTQAEANPSAQLP